MKDHRTGPEVNRVVVCDLDDTLYLERDYVESGLSAAGAWADRQFGTSNLAAALIARFRNGQRTRLFDDTLDAIGAGTSPGRVKRMLEAYRQHRPRIALAEDAARFLARRSHNTAIALVTDGFLDAQRRKIRALGLHRRGVEMAICTDRWGRADWKPSPRAFQLVQAFFGVPSDALVYVADNPTKDFHAPRQLGWRTFQIRRPGGLHGSLAGVVCADADITSFDELT